MAFRASIRNKFLIPAVALSSGTAVVLVPKRMVFAEEPVSPAVRAQVPEVKRKPIYDDDDNNTSAVTYSTTATATLVPTSSTSSTTARNTITKNDENILKEGPPTLHPFPSHDNFPPSPPSSSSSSSSSSPPSSSPSSSISPSPTSPSNPSHLPQTCPTPTDRLAAHIAHTRLTLHHYISAAERRFNANLTRALHLEHSFTSTIASLAPPPSSGERVLPGLLYVLVASMAGSIVSRNRTFILRFATPVAFAVGMGYVVVPRTMENVRNLVWKVEERLAPPVIRDMQGRIGAEVERVWETGKAHSNMAVGRLEEGAREAREGVEAWVSGRK